MVIPKKDSCRIIYVLCLMAAIFLLPQRMCSAQDDRALEVLCGTYKPDVVVITPAEAKSTIAKLKSVLADCKDKNLAFRVRYRIAITQFKAQMTDVSKAGFRHIVKESDCPLDIRMCSLNMIGQICRLHGQNTPALEAFDTLANLIEGQSSAVKKHNKDAAAKLLFSALVSRAEIYELIEDYAAAIKEYNRLLAALGGANGNDVAGKNGPLINDRMSQLYLRQGQIDKYVKAAGSLIVDYPQYYRTPLVKLELKCVEFLKNAAESVDFSSGSFVAPAKVIAYLKDSDEKASAKELAAELDKFCQECESSYEGILLKYHYAWLLDTVGQKAEAAEKLAGLCLAHIENPGDSSRQAIVDTIRGYACIQSAIMLTEQGRYKKATGILNTLGKCPEGSHLSKLVQSLRKGIDILKREVPKNENDKT